MSVGDKGRRVVLLGGVAAGGGRGEKRRQRQEVASTVRAGSYEGEDLGQKALLNCCILSDDLDISG